jgi:hypothetical protein
MVCEAVRSQAQLMIQQVEAVEAAAQQRRRRRPASSWWEGGASAASPPPLLDTSFLSSTLTTPQTPSPSTIPTISIDACLSLADDLSTDSENEEEGERRPEVRRMSISEASEAFSPCYSRTPSPLLLASPSSRSSSGTAAAYSEMQRLQRALTECQQAVIELQSSAQLKQQHLELQVLSWKQRYEQATMPAACDISVSQTAPQGDAPEENNGVASVSLHHQECERLREENYRWQAVLLEPCSTCHERRSLTSVKRQLWTAVEERADLDRITNKPSSSPKASAAPSRRLHRSALQLLAQMEGHTSRGIPCLRNPTSTTPQGQGSRLQKGDKSPNYTTCSPPRPVKTDLVKQQGRLSHYLRTSPASVSTRSSTTCSTSECFSIDEREMNEVVAFENRGRASGIGLGVLARIERSGIKEH